MLPLERGVHVVDVRLADLHIVLVLVHVWLLLLLHTKARHCTTRLRQVTVGSAGATMAIHLLLKAAFTLVECFDHALD